MQQVVASIERLLNATSGWEHQVVARPACGRVSRNLVFVLMSRPGKQKGTIEFLYTRAI